MKRSTKKIVWERRSRDFAIGLIKQRGKPDLIIIRFRKGAETLLDIDTVPTSREPEPSAEELLAEQKERVNQVCAALGLKGDDRAHDL